MLIGVIILAVVFYLTTPVEQKEYTYSEIETLFREEKVKSFSLEGDELTLNLYSADSDGKTTIKKTLPNPSWFREDLGELGIVAHAGGLTAAGGDLRGSAFHHAAPTAQDAPHFPEPEDEKGGGAHGGGRAEGARLDDLGREHPRGAGDRALAGSL